MTVSADDGIEPSRAVAVYNALAVRVATLLTTKLNFNHKKSLK